MKASLVVERRLYNLFSTWIEYCTGGLVRSANDARILYTFEKFRRTFPFLATLHEAQHGLYKFASYAYVYMYLYNQKFPHTV